MLNHVEDKNAIRNFLIDFVNFKTISESMESMYKFIQDVYGFENDFHKRISLLFCPAKKSNLHDAIIAKESKYAKSVPLLVLNKGRRKIVQDKRCELVAGFHKKLLAGYKNLRLVKLEIKDILCRLAIRESIIGLQSIKRITNKYQMIQDTRWFVRDVGINSDGWPYCKQIIEEEDFLSTSILHDRKYDSDLSWGNEYEFILYECLFVLFQTRDYINRIERCSLCQKLYIKSTRHKRKYCSKKCRIDASNRRRIATGEHARYKRERRRQGKATVGYY